MLNVGLTGGMGAGKSAVSARLADLGAVIVDSDLIAREVVEPGTGGLAEVVSAFGDAVLDTDGRLDRPALGRIVFGDSAALARLNAIVHPLVRDRSAQIAAAAGSKTVVVHDVPLLVENGMAAQFALVVVVHAELEDRISRMLASRPLSEAELRARIGAQATDADRADVADVLLENSGSAADLDRAVERLWAERLFPYADNLAHGRPADPGAGVADGAALARTAARIAVLTPEDDVAVDPSHALVVVSSGDPATAARLAVAGWYPDRSAELPLPSVLLPAVLLHSADPGEKSRLELLTAQLRP